MKALLLDLVGGELASLCDLTAIFSSLYDAGSDSNHQIPGKTEIWSVNKKIPQPWRISLHHCEVKCQEYQTQTTSARGRLQLKWRQKVAWCQVRLMSCLDQQKISTRRQAHSHSSDKFHHLLMLPQKTTFFLLRENPICSVTRRRVIISVDQ